MFTSNEQILPRTIVTGVAFSFLNLFYVTFRSPKNYSEVTYRALHAKKVVSNGGGEGGGGEGKFTKAKTTSERCFHWSRGCCNELVLRLTMT